MPAKGVKAVYVCICIGFIMFNSLLMWTQLKDRFPRQLWNSSDQDTTYQEYSRLIFILSNVTSLPPPAPISPTCRPPPLPFRPDCSGQPGLTGQAMENPRKLCLMILFGFEVDTLEIALREQLHLGIHKKTSKLKMFQLGEGRGSKTGNFNLKLGN